MANKTLQISPEDLAKIQERKANDEKLKVDPEWLALAEFGYYYGWDAIQAVLSNEIDGETLVMLLQGARKLEARRFYDNAKASFIGGASANSKKPSQTFTKAVKGIEKSMKADI
jgi:hypothetical protein